VEAARVMNDVVTDTNTGDARQDVTDSALSAPRQSARPKFLFVIVALLVGSSFYVVKEPAPCDLLFVFLCLVAPFYQGFRLSFDINPVLTLSLAAFVFGNIVSFWFAATSFYVELETGKSLLYMTVTIYLVLYWYVISTLIGGYGLSIIHIIKKAFIFAACAATIIGLMVQAGLVPADILGVENNTKRIAASFKDANVYAPFLSAALIWLASDIINKTRLPWFEIIVLCFLAVGMVGAISRGGFVNVIVSLLLLVILQMMISLRMRWLRRLFMMTMFVVLLAVPAVGFYLSSGDGREELFQQRLQLQRYDVKRFAVQAETLRQIAEFPLGVGPGQTQQVLPQNPHNLYLLVMFENGLLGGLGFVFFLMACLWICLSGTLRGGPYASLYACCLAILAGTLVNSLVIDTLHWRHLFLFLAIPVGLDRFERAQARLAWSRSDRADIATAAARAQQRRSRQLGPSSDHAGYVSR
jgi:O-antigen ligase